MRRIAPWVPLALVLVLGAALRLFMLGTVPTELSWDEIDLWNSAHSIATTGHDVDGRLSPFLYGPITRNPPVYAIAGYLSTLLFGQNAFAWRLPAALFGLATILLVYGVARELVRRRDAALLAALLAAVQPIFVHFSRIGWEPGCELPFLLGGLYALLRAFRRADDEGRPVAPPFAPMAVGALLLGATAYTYMAGWFYAAALGGALLALNAWRIRSWRTALTFAGAIAIWIATATPALQVWFFDPLTAARTSRIATFAHGVDLRSLRVFASDYLSHFRWSYLVTTGDPRPGLTWRYLNGFGAFFGWVVALAAAGAVAARWYVRPRWAVLWTWLWVVLYPFGGALTDEGAPNAPRTLAGAPVFVILAAIAIVACFDLTALLRPRRLREICTGLARALAVVGMIWGTVSFSLFYFTRSVHAASNAWESGTAALFAEIVARAPAYDRVCFELQPAWYPTMSYTRYYLWKTRLAFIPNAADPQCGLPGTLVATDQQHLPAFPGFVRLATVDDVDGRVFANLYGKSR